MAATAIRPRPPVERSQLARSAATPTCIRLSTDSPGFLTPSPCPTRREPPQRRSSLEPRSGSQPTASPTSTASSPTTGPVTALVTSSGSLARTRSIRRPSRTPHDTTERSSATSESWPRNCSTPESSAAKMPAPLRSLSGTSTHTYVDRTARQVDGRQHLVAGPASLTFNPHTVSAHPHDRRRAHHQPPPLGASRYQPAQRRDRARGVAADDT